MLRRSFLTGLTSATFGLGARRLARGQAQVSLRIVVDAATTGVKIPPDFIGLSYESALLADGAYFSPDNTSLIGLIQLLGPHGIVRIGGNTSEDTVWQARDQATPPGRFVLTPACIDRLAVVLRRVGWKLIYGLNLARGMPEAAADEAAYVARALGSDLLAFQIGNEPDGFGRWRTVRLKSYDAAAYLAEWGAFHRAIRARVPNAHFAGPDVAMETGWVGELAQSHPAGLVLLTRHYYADGPAGAPQVSLAKLLRSEQQIVPVLDALDRTSRSYGLPFRIAEANSIYNEGEPGVSDTLGAALWGLELMFQLAAAGAAGVNFHAGPHNLQPEVDKAYTPIASTEGGRYRPAPLYYAMLLFSRLAPGAIVPLQMTRAGELPALAVRAPDGTLRVGLINKNLAGDVRVSIDPGSDVTAASILRLGGPSVQATAGITLGGASMGEFGAWVPTEERTTLRGREVSILLPPTSAAIVTIALA
jgi:hypothetical protein